MRDILASWQHGVMSFALAATCVSGLNMAGCTKSPSRTASPVFSKHTGESAVRAEQSLAERARNSAAEEKDHLDQEKPGKVTLSSTPQRSTRNPLADLLAEKKAQPPRPSQDPFLDRSASDEAIAQPINSVQQAEGVDQQAEREVLLTKHLRAQRQEPAMAAASDLEAASSAVAKPFPEGGSVASFAEDKSRPTVDVAGLPDLKPQNRFVASTNDVPPTAQQQAGEAEPVLVRSAERFDEFSTPDLGMWKPLEQPRTAQQNQFIKASESDQRSVVVASSNAKQPEHAARLKLLMSYAQEQLQRGELHAAYRSALLAKSIAENNNLNFAADETHPEVFAQEIAARIWGTQLGTSAPEPASDLPKIQPRRMSSLQHDSVFNTSASYLDWQASPGDGDPSGLDGTPQLSSKTAGKNSSQPAFAAKPYPVAVVTSDQSVGERSVEIQRASALTVEHSKLDDSVAATVEHPVTYAVAQQEATSEQKARASVAPLAAPQQIPHEIQLHETQESVPALSFPAVKNSPPEFAAIHIDRNPFVVEPLPVTDSDAESQVAKVEAETQQAAATESPRNQFRWGVIAFILATISTLIGLRFSGAKSQASHEDDQSRQEEKDDTSAQSFKISKAA